MDICDYLKFSRDILTPDIRIQIAILRIQISKILWIFDPSRLNLRQRF